MAWLCPGTGKPAINPDNETVTGPRDHDTQSGIDNLKSLLWARHRRPRQNRPHRQGSIRPGAIRAQDDQV